jgi:hypothetical protein
MRHFCLVKAAQGFAVPAKRDKEGVRAKPAQERSAYAKRAIYGWTLFKV